MTTAAEPRPMPRASWFAARARNAARRGVQVATMGGTAVILTVLILVLIPREVDRAIRAEIAALPAGPDTNALLANVTARQGAHERAEAELRTARRTDSIVVAILAREAARADSIALLDSARGQTTVAQDNTPRDAEGADLLQRINRARSAPLLESYRDLAQSPLMRGDARVRSIIDSMQAIDREREAYAALGGPDARYAALSSRMTALGQRLIRLAESQLARPVASPSPAITVDAPSDSTRTAELRLPRRRTSEEMQALAAAAAQAEQDVRRAEQTVVEARATHVQLEQRRQDARSRASLPIPPPALVVAAIVVGVVTGLGGALGFELRTPRVADAVEAERIAGTRVIAHNGIVDRSRLLRMRRRADRALPPVFDITSESFHLLHLTLTGVGDVARRVRVRADMPSLAAAVAANLAAAAARDARAVLLTDLDVRNRKVAAQLQVADRRGMSDVLAGDAELIEAVRDYPVGRDVYMTVLYGGQKSARSTPERRMVVHQDLDRLASRYDLTVAVADDGAPEGDVLLDTTDVILAVRAGFTPNAWLARAVARERKVGNRVRAVVVWGANAPVS